MPTLTLGQAIVDNTGRLVAMLYSGEAAEIRTNLVLPAPGWTRTYTLPAADQVTITRADDATTWKGSISMDASHRIDFVQTVRQANGKVAIDLDYTAAGDLATEGLFLRIDLPWQDFISGNARYDTPGQIVTFPVVAPSNNNLLGGTTTTIAAVSAANTLNWTARFDRAFFVNLQDKSSESPKAFTFWVYLVNGPAIRNGAHSTARVELAADGVPDTTPARLTLDPVTRYRFFGFGGNYAFQTDSPVARYTLDNLAVRWARVEMSLDDWVPVNDNLAAGIDWGRFEQRDRPGTRLRSQLEMARSLKQRGIPFVASVWRLPEWMYADRGTRGPNANGRKVDPALWNELLASIGAYLQWARDRYGAEPDLFSFNEANIGINVLFSAQEHRDAIKSIGAYLESRGLKTRMLLGDVHAPRFTIPYVDPAASDPEALRYCGALSFHSWGGAAAEVYGQWGDLAQRLGLPLLVAELGTDASAYVGRAYDSFWYGLNEVRMYQEILLYARPQATMYWEFTADYSLLDASLQPTARFWFTKQFTDLTPPDAEVLGSNSDQAKVLFTAFRKDGRHTFHIANFGAARQVRVEGVPEGAWRAVYTSETAAFADFPLDPPSSGALFLQMPERSLVTVTTQ